MEEILNRVLAKIVDLEAYVREKVATKEEVAQFKNEVFTMLDAQGVILKRLDQEHVMSLERFKRIENDVEVLKRK